MSDAHTTTAEATPIRFSIRSLLVAVTIVCVLLAPYHWFGGWYLFSALCSCGLIYFSYRGYIDPKKMSPVKVALVAIFGGLCIGLNSLVFLLHATLNLAASVTAPSLKLTPRAYAVSLVMLGFVAYSFFMTLKYTEFRELYALRNWYPETSLEDRLGFEKRNHQAALSEAHFALDSNVGVALSRFEAREGETAEYWRDMDVGQIAR